MNTFYLVISSPDGNLYSGDVQRIILRGAEGDLAVMAGHIPFITSVKPGECRITLENGEEKIAETSGGLLTVSSEKVTLICGKCKFN
ncbi:MAG: hypothetical protein II802_02785 [Clostridia bacterium]|nr:hypothetical protein [Clostridia bacterium]